MTALLSLGQSVFQIIGLNYQKLSTQTTANWAAIERFGGQSARQFTGLGPDSTTIDGLLFPDELGGRGQYEAIRRTQGRGRPVMMIGFGANSSGKIFGNVVIEEVSDTQTHIARHGGGKMLEFSITVAPYGGGFF